MQKNKPVISIIIPVYNVARFLPRCLDSLLNQTFKDWEAICVNDGSIDNSADILAEYGARDSRFTVVNKKNGGISDARNVGVGYAMGDYIMYLDSDDFIHPQALEIMHYVVGHESAEMALFRFDETFHKFARKIMRSGHDISHLLPPKRNIVYNKMRVRFWETGNILMHCTERNRGFGVRRPVRRHCFVVLGLYRRELVINMPFIRGIIMEDFPWWSAILLRRPRTVITKLPLYFYMPNTSSVLNSSKALRMIESLAVGLEYVYDLYSKQASQIEFEYYKREFLWPFIIIVMRKVRELDNLKDINMAKKIIKKLYTHGVMDNPPNLHARRYLRRIQDFIG